MNDIELQLMNDMTRNKQQSLSEEQLEQLAYDLIHSKTSMRSTITKSTTGSFGHVAVLSLTAFYANNDITFHALIDIYDDAIDIAETFVSGLDVHLPKSYRETVAMGLLLEAITNAEVVDLNRYNAGNN